MNIFRKHPRRIFLAVGTGLIVTLLSAPAQAPPEAPGWVALEKPYVAVNDSLVRGNIVDADYLDAIPLGDIDNSGTDDFALVVRVTRVDSTDTSTAHFPIIVRSHPGRESYLVDTSWLHPEHFKSGTSLIGAGDWDNNGYTDLCMDIRIHGDTTVGPTLGKEIHRVAIFWNDGRGGFSFSDTTRLPNPEGTPNDVWGSTQAMSFDYNGDSVDDLLIKANGGFLDGERTPTASMYLFYGHDGQRWGRNGTPATPVWSWWNLPRHNRARILDQNCDDIPDIAFFADEVNPRFPDLTIFYGSEASLARGLPDTTDADSVFVREACGRSTYIELEDYTSDGVLDIITTCEDEFWEVFAGEPGWRSSKVYGSGNDTADPDNGFPNNRPWTRIPMPGRLSNGWGSPIYGPIMLLGDVNHDGWRDLWSFANKTVLVYSAGPGFDAFIDGYLLYGGDVDNLVNLGHIDGTDRITYALVNHLQNVSGVQFFLSSPSVPNAGVPKPVPAGHDPVNPTPNRCGSTVSVEEEPTPSTDSLDLTLRNSN